MQYRIDDLMISVAPRSFPELGTIVQDCTGDTCGGGGSGCSPVCTDCSACGTASDNFGFLDELIYPPYLQNLKSQIRMALSAVEARERELELEERGLPQTAEEIEIMERKLTAALRTLQAQRTQGD